MKFLQKLPPPIIAILDLSSLSNTQYLQLPNPDKPEKWPPRHKDTKQNCLQKLNFVFWCLGGENVFAQNAKNSQLRL
jgi:hypothetical protein